MATYQLFNYYIYNKFAATVIYLLFEYHSF